jgi:hypothetical protein
MARKSSSVGSGDAITISFSNGTPDKEFPGALAYAQPFAGRILVFRDRIDKFLPQMRARVLAYVLAHEIAHVLQGIVRHSDSGIMKAHWYRGDFRAMFSMNLKFTTYDVLLIHNGLDTNLSHKTGGLQSKQPDGTWTYLVRSSWYDTGTMKYETCTSLSSEGTAEIGNVASGLLLLKKQLAGLGGEPTVRLNLMIFCRQLDGKVLTTSVTTDAFGLRLPTQP